MSQTNVIPGLLGSTGWDFFMFWEGHVSKHWLILPLDTICPKNTVVDGLELLLRGLWMARGELFLADELMPQVETTGGLPDPQLSFNNPQRALLYNCFVSPSHHLE